MNDGFKKSWKTSVVKQRKQWSEGEGRYQAEVDFFFLGCHWTQRA